MFTALSGDFAVRYLWAGSSVDRVGVQLRPTVLPGHFIDHDAPRLPYEQARLNVKHITTKTLGALRLDVLARQTLALPARA